MAVPPQIVNRAAHQAAQMIVQNNMRRQRATFAVIPAAPPKATSVGYDVAKTFTIYESVPVEGVIQYELLVDDESVWVGMGDDRVEGLLAVIMKITDQEPNVPDN